MSDLIRLLAGILVLILGRQLFWLFVAVVGFLVGASLATQFLSGESELVMLAVALAVGLVGALLGLVLPSLVGVLAGFAAGGYLAVLTMGMVDVPLGELTWLPFVIGGVAGAIVVLVLFDWALIGLSSLVGAVTIANALALHGTPALLVSAVLFFIGVSIQAGLWTRRSRQPSASYRR